MWRIVVGCLVFALAGCSLVGGSGERPVPPAPGSPTWAVLDGLLARVPVVAVRPQVPGYERGCANGQRCVFGPAWSDDHPGPGGHDGCDTRNNVLARDLVDATFRDGTHGCVVVSGTLADPYSGRRIEFRKSDAQAVQIDHVYSLAAAWDLGAAHWSLERRRQFANDITFNLLAVGGADNEAKGDHTPSDWLPPAPAYHCFFAGKYLGVAVRYGLPITAADHEVLHRVARGCG